MNEKKKQIPLIQKLRLDMGLTQRQAAELTETSYSVYRQYEAGTVKPRYYKMKNIEQKLNMPSGMDLFSIVDMPEFKINNVPVRRKRYKKKGDI